MPVPVEIGVADSNSAPVVVKCLIEGAIGTPTGIELHCKQAHPELLRSDTYGRDFARAVKPSLYR